MQIHTLRPALALGLISLGEAGRVRLFWDSSASDDVVGYVIYRSQGDEDPVALNDVPLAVLEYSDSDVASGATYRYTVRGVDTVGNLGEESSPSSARVP